MTKINFLLNGNPYSIDKDSNISKLIKILELDPKKIAIEKDLEIIAPENFNNTFLQDNCRIEIVHFIGGG